MISLFLYPDLEFLYQTFLDIYTALLKRIMPFPRICLASDLELLIDDSVILFKYFSQGAMANGWADKDTSIVYHAIFPLAELEVVDRLPVVLKALSQSKEYVDLYFGVTFKDCLWEPLS